LWGAQVNRGATPVAYVATTTAVRAGLAVDYDLTSHAAKGLLVEPAATNILLNNATLSTQSVSSAAQQYTLSFWGTGTITLTGTSTAGPLVGTGASNRVSLTFQPTAGTLTLTVSGTVTNAQLEQNAVATSLIPVLGVAVTRTADAVTVATSAFPWAAAAANSIVVQAASLVPASATYLNLHDGTDAERHVIDTNAGAKQGRYLVTDGSAAQADIGAVAAAVAGTYYKVGAAAAANDAATCVNGGTVATDATVTLPTVTTLTLGGSRATPGGNVYIKTLKIVPRRMTNPELVTATT
jgi:hypothetical protein